VFGADSTTTYPNEHYYNHAQKIFEVGPKGSPLGMVIWGLGSLGDLSYRTLIAKFAEDNRNAAPASVREMADRFAHAFWPEYQARMAPLLQRFQQLVALPAPTADEQKERDNLAQVLSGGFCLGGNRQHDPTPHACAIQYGPSLAAAQVDELPMHTCGFWGQPSMIQRLMFGIDADLRSEILQCGLWHGTPADLENLVNKKRLTLPGAIPIREAIDYVHASVYSTIKTMKFSQLAPVCGGPVELAVITTDRPFRWVRHTDLDVAIPSGGLSHV
jgi:hypothetical protein